MANEITQTVLFEVLEELALEEKFLQVLIGFAWDNYSLNDVDYAVEDGSIDWAIALSRQLAQVK